MFNAKLNLKSADILMRSRGLQEMGHVQKYIDSECLRLMEPYTPMFNGALIKSAVIGTVIGSGEIHQDTPYAHYLHESILYVSPTTGSSWAKMNEVKVSTGKPLKYHGGAFRGKKWFDRMVADHKDDILAGAQKIANRGVK